MKNPILESFKSIRLHFLLRYKVIKLQGSLEEPWRAPNFNILNEKIYIGMVYFRGLTEGTAERKLAALQCVVIDKNIIIKLSSYKSVALTFLTLSLEDLAV